jgi:hypothetical protein
MVTLKERIKTEFGDLLPDSSIENHLIPVFTEWLLSNRERQVGHDFNRRTSHDTVIDRLIMKARL